MVIETRRIIRNPYLLLIVCCAVLLGIPLTAWMLHWNWNASQQSAGLFGFYLLTQTVSRPYGMIIAALLVGALIYALRIRKAEWFKYAVVLLLPIILGQLAVNMIKRTTPEPRPYIVWLSQTDSEIDRHFYQVDSAERQAMLNKRLESISVIPQWQKQHWLNQTDSAFPSGHTVFAATWALMAVSLLLARGKRLLATIIMLWAMGVIISRLLLGMHWPGDLFTSIMIAFYLSLPAVYFLCREAEEKRHLSKRCSKR